MIPPRTARRPRRLALLSSLLLSLAFAVPALAGGGVPVQPPEPTPCVEVTPVPPGPGYVSPLGYPTNPPPKPPPPANCDLAIQKTAPATAAPGTTIVFSVSVGNVGDLPVARSDIHVTDPSLTPGELEFFAVLSGDADDVLDPGEVWEYRLPGGVVLSRPADVCGVITNTALLAPLPGETSTGNNTSSSSTTVAGPQCVPPPGPGPTTPIPPPGVTGESGGPAGPTRITISKWSRRAGVARRPIPFRITVKNVGNAVAQDVWISDRLPAGTSAIRRPKGATLRHGFLRWHIGDIAPGKSVRVGLWLRTDTNKARNLCNTARAVGGNASRVLDQACTRLVRIAGVQTPPPRVTG
jgi:hypothetical protein